MTDSGTPSSYSASLPRLGQKQNEVGHNTQQLTRNALQAYQQVLDTQHHKHSVFLRSDPGSSFSGASGPLNRCFSTLGPLSAENAVLLPSSLASQTYRKARSIGIWQHSKQSCLVVRSRGTALHHSRNRWTQCVEFSSEAKYGVPPTTLPGISQQILFLPAEETLFLMERGNLLLFSGQDARLMTIQNVYQELFETSGSSTAKGPQLSLENYIVYATARRAGAMLHRHQRASSRTSAQNIPTARCGAVQLTADETQTFETVWRTLHSGGTEEGLVPFKNTLSDLQTPNSGSRASPPSVPQIWTPITAQSGTLGMVRYLWNISIQQNELSLSTKKRPLISATQSDSKTYPSVSEKEDSSANDVGAVLAALNSQSTVLSRKTKTSFPLLHVSSDARVWDTLMQCITKVGNTAEEESWEQAVIAIEAPAALPSFLLVTQINPKYTATAHANDISCLRKTPYKRIKIQRR